MRNKKRNKEDSNDNFSGECSEVMDILSLIPPEILNKRGNGDDSDTSIEEIEAELPNDIQNFNKEDGEVHVEEMDVGLDEETTPENDVNESIPSGNKNDTAENSTCANEDYENVDKRNILHDITCKFLNGHRSRKWKDLNLTPEMLFTDILDNAVNIQKLKSMAVCDETILP